MQAIANPFALRLAEEIRQAVAPDSLLYETLNQEGEMEKLRRYIARQNEEAEKAAQEAVEDMLASALQSNVPSEALEFMRQRAGITEARFAELKDRVFGQYV